jgi:hypothetical protein
MPIARVLISVLLFLLGGWLSLINIEPIFSTQLYVKTSGVLNVWGGYGSFLLGGYGFFYHLNQLIKLPFPVGDFNRLILIIALIISPLLTIGTYEAVRSNISGYVECSNLRELSSRYSSRTYAKSESSCLQLREEKEH